MVSVLTPTIPERRRLLRECEQSVWWQTFHGWEHLILEDTDRLGCAPTINRLAEAALGEWLFLLADDDLMLPGCLWAHLKLADGADVVYAPPLVWGEDAAQFHLSPPYIPSSSLIRAELWEKLGGYNDLMARTEDRDFYERAMAVGARFVRADTHPCWVYRFHGGNKSRSPG